MTTLEEEATSGADFLSSYLEYSKTFFKTNLKSILASGGVYALSRFNPYKRAPKRRYFLGYPIDEAIFEAIYSMSITYSNTVEEIFIAPIFMNLNLTNKAMVSGLKALYSRMITEVLFEPYPDYTIGAIYFISAAGADFASEILAEKAGEGAATEGGA